MRRERAKLMLFFKISRVLVAIPMPSYVQPLHNCRTCQYHPARNIAVNCGTNAGVQGEFLPRHDKLVACLPPEVIIQPNIKASRLAWTIFI